MDVARLPCQGPDLDTPLGWLVLHVDLEHEVALLGDHLLVHRHDLLRVSAGLEVLV